MYQNTKLKIKNLVKFLWNSYGINVEYFVLNLNSEGVKYPECSCE